MTFARTVQSFSFGSAFLTLVSSIAVAQYVPIRDLDPLAAVDSEKTIKTVDGLVVGYARSAAGVLEPVFFDRSGATLLPFPSGATEGYAVDLNRGGSIVGTVIDYSRFVQLGVVWTNGVPTVLDTLVNPGSSWSIGQGNAIDERGRIACTGFSATTTRAMILDQGVLTDLGTLTTFASESAAMNEELEVGGTSDTSKGRHACLFRGGQVIDLHDPSFMVEGFEFVNDLDRFARVVGSYQAIKTSYILDQRAFFWDGTRSVDLAPAFPPGYSYAYGINDFGDIVGSYTKSGGSGGPLSAFLWQNGVVTDLNTLIDPTLGWVLTEATGIDDEQRIAGTGLLNGVQTGFILEPDCKGTFTTYGTGCAGTGGLEPVLRGAGCPAPDRPFAVEVRDGRASAVGFFFIGLGTGTIQVRPGCDLQVLPLALPIVPVVLDGRGELWIEERLPIGTSIFDVNLQALFFDPGAAHGIAATKPLALHFE